MTNADPQELAKFSELAHRWWDTESEFRPLHQINPLRRDWIDRQARLAGKRVLDIGCGGGILSDSMARGGASVLGIDLASKPLKVAQLHALEAGTENVEYREVAAEALAAEAPGSFDIVTCNDVIEHVLDPSSLVHNIAGVLRHDGIAYLEIPNRYFPGFVRQDGHYQLFGITLLERPEAQRYYEHYFTEIPYRTGHYLTLDQYDRMFRLAGLGLTVLEQTYEGSLDEGAIVGAVAELRANAGSGLEQVPHDLRGQVREALRHYLHQVETSLPETEAKRDSLVLRYGVSFWKLIVRHL